MPKTNVEPIFYKLLKRLGEKDWYAQRMTTMGATLPTYFHLYSSGLRAEFQPVDWQLSRTVASEQAHRQTYVTFSARYRNTLALDRLHPPCTRRSFCLWPQLCNDEIPMVRRAAAANFSEFCACLTTKERQSQALSWFRVLSEDKQDSVRLFAVNHCIGLAKSLPSTFIVKHVSNFDWHDNWLPSLARVQSFAVCHKLIYVCSLRLDLAGCSRCDHRPRVASSMGGACRPTRNCNAELM